MKRSGRFAVKLLLLTKKLPARQKMIVLSIIIGFVVGLLAVLMKTLVFTIIELLTGGFSVEYNNYWYLIYPAIGILATLFFVKFIRFDERLIGEIFQRLLCQGDESYEYSALRLG